MLHSNREFTLKHFLNHSLDKKINKTDLTDNFKVNVKLANLITSERVGEWKPERKAMESVNLILWKEFYSFATQSFLLQNSSIGGLHKPENVWKKKLTKYLYKQHSLLFITFTDMAGFY